MPGWESPYEAHGTATAGPAAPAAVRRGPKPQTDTSRPTSARVYDYLLGGKDNYSVDRAVGDLLPPLAREGARANRAFMRRAARWIACQGVDQFLDIGTGMPCEPNLHQIAQHANPRARIVYVDNDPIVVRHAEALLVGGPEGVIGHVEADARAPGRIIDEAGRFLDWRRPVAVSMTGVLHFLPGASSVWGVPDDPHAIVRTLVDALPSGSYLALSHGASDTHRESVPQIEAGYAAGGIALSLRTRAEFARFFDGLRIQEPGIVNASEWYRDTPAPERSERPAAGLYGGVGRKP